MDGRQEFEEFFTEVEPRLRLALGAVFGPEAGRDAAAAALAYGWEHWERIRSMENPAGYLYRVGRSSQRRRKEPEWRPVPATIDPLVEPGLPAALADLSEKQRVVIVLVHGYGWARNEVAELTGLPISTVDTHLSRGLRRLRYRLGVKSHA